MVVEEKVIPSVRYDNNIFFINFMKYIAVFNLSVSSKIKPVKFIRRNGFHSNVILTLRFVRSYTLT